MTTPQADYSNGLNRTRGIMHPDRTQRSHAEKTAELKSAMQNAKFWMEEAKRLKAECIAENIASVQDED